MTRTRHRFSLSLLTLLSLLCLPLLSACAPHAGGHYELVGGRETVLCVRVIDGDTIVLSDGRHVRLIDRDAFEIRHGARLARQAAAAGITVEAALARGREQAAQLRQAVEGRRLVIKWAKPLRDQWGRWLGAIIEGKQ